MSVFTGAVHIEGVFFIFLLNIFFHNDIYTYKNKYHTAEKSNPYRLPEEEPTEKGSDERLEEEIDASASDSTEPESLVPQIERNSSRYDTQIPYPTTKR